MANKQIIHTDDAPKAIGTYSQAVRVGNAVYLSGQIPLDPKDMTLVSEDFQEQAHQVFKNLHAVCVAAGGNLNQIVKLNLYLCDLNQFALLNEIMSQYFEQPYPARAAIGVNALPKGAQLEADGVLHLGEEFNV